MTNEMLLSIAGEASIVLAADNRVFSGETIFAAEYAYFKAMREGRLEPQYWIAEALDIVEIEGMMCLEGVTLDEQPKEDEDE